MSDFGRGVKCAGGESAPACPRRELFGRAFVGVAAVAGVSLFGRAGNALGASSRGQDELILNLVLRLEYTEAAFYGEAIRNGILRGGLHEYAQAAEQHEQDHVRFLRHALGTKAAARPSFKFGRATQDPDAFTHTAIKLEDLAVAGYNGQAANLSATALKAAATIVSVEARHAAWIRAISGRVAAPDAVDKPVTAVELEHGLRQIGMRP